MDEDEQICDLAHHLKRLDQYRRNTNFELNISAKKEIKIHNKLEVELKEDDIEAARRLPKIRTENRLATIIVQLARRKLRDRVLEARKKVLTNADVTGL
ncbi:hypothetical protein J6590_008537 [Homalodisca vitripennis]|nr:hypothetical protein J6590_008537 [Homalodisca vitripennis]